jgi:ribonuclease J
MRHADGTGRLADLAIYKDLKGSRDGFEKQVMAAHAGRLLDPDRIAADPGSYICCFSFFDVKNLLDIRTEGGTYIYSSSEAHGEEQKTDFVRLANWLDRFAFTIRGFSLAPRDNGTPEPVFDRGYHASGHASAQDLLRIVRTIDPEIVMPVHTELPSFFAENLPDMQVIVPENGREYVVG